MASSVRTLPTGTPGLIDQTACCSSRRKPGAPTRVDRTTYDMLRLMKLLAIGRYTVTGGGRFRPWLRSSPTTPTISNHSPGAPPIRLAIAFAGSPQYSRAKFLETIAIGVG